MNCHLCRGVFFVSQKEKRFDFRFLLRAVLAWLLCAALLLLCAAVFYAADGASLSTMGYAGSAISFLAALAAGAGAAGKEKDRRFFAALLSALLLCAVLLLTGYLIAGRLDRSAVLSVVSFTLSGGFAGALFPGDRRRRRGREKAKRFT